MKKRSFLGLMCALVGNYQIGAMVEPRQTARTTSTITLRADQVKVGIAAQSQTPSLLLPGQVQPSGSDEKRSAEGGFSGVTSPSIQPVSTPQSPQHRQSRKSSIHNSRLRQMRHHHHRSSLFGSQVDIKEMLNPDASFLAAAERGDIAQMNKLKSIANINALDEQGNTALYNAIKARDNATARYLLGQPEINVNIKNKNGRTVLHEVCQDLNEELFNILLSKDVINIIAVAKDDKTKETMTARNYLKSHAEVQSTPQAKAMLIKLDLLFKKQKDYLMKHVKDATYNTQLKKFNNEQLQRFKEYEDSQDKLDFEGLTPESYRTGCC